MMPVSSASSPELAAGSMATTTRTRSGITNPIGGRAASMSARLHSAPGTSSSSSAFRSWRPSRGPSDFLMICWRNAPARLARFSYLEPRVTTQVGSPPRLALRPRRSGPAAGFAKPAPSHQKPYPPGSYGWQLFGPGAIAPIVFERVGFAGRHRSDERVDLGFRQIGELLEQGGGHLF